MVNSILNDAKKVAYLVELYPKKSLQEILDLLLIPNISKDCAIWEAETRGWITISPKKKKISRTDVAAPLPMDDDMLLAIKERVVYILSHQNNIEEDIDEVLLLTWLAGFPAHEILIALNLLLDDNIITNYTITEDKKGKNVYTFWTLPGNEVHAWGTKRFKDQKNLKVAPKGSMEL